MIYKNTILKILKSLNLSLDENNAKLIAEYANKGDANVDKITQTLTKVPLKQVIERAKVFVYNNTPSYKQFLEAVTPLDLFDRDTTDLDRLYRKLYSFFVKQNLTLTEILSVLKSEEMSNFINQPEKVIPIKMFLGKIQSILNQQMSAVTEPTNLPADVPAELYDSDVPNTLEEIPQEIYACEEANINIINNLSAISRKLASSISPEENPDLDTAYTQTIIYAIYNMQEPYPITNLMHKLNALKLSVQHLIDNKSNAEVYASLQYLLSCLPNDIEKIDKLIDKANADANVANMFILDIIAKQKSAKNTPLDITKYRLTVNYLEESIKILSELKQDETNLILNSALKKIKPLLEKSEKPYNEAKERQRKLKQDKADYLAEFGKIAEIKKNLKQFKLTLSEIYQTIKSALNVVESKEVDEQTIKAKIAKLKDEIETLTEILNHSLKKHNKEFKYFDRSNDSEIISQQHIDCKRQRLEIAKQNLANLQALLNNKTV